VTATGAPSNIFPSLRYRDAPAAIEWLVRVLGFKVHTVIDGPDNTIAHAELTIGNGMIMLGSDVPRDGVPSQPAGSAWIYIVLADVDAHHAHARSEGATIAMDLVDTGYGSRDYAVRDPEGNLWNFGTYNPFTQQG
jgi:uncharacterized glyoxalase superfamily protein PhnB